MKTQELMNKEPYMEYLEEMLSAIDICIPGARVQEINDIKANIPSPSFAVDDGSDIAFVIHPHHFWEQYKSGTTCKDIINEFMKQNSNSKSDILYLIDMFSEHIKHPDDHLYLEVMNIEDNLSIIGKCPHHIIPGTDLIAVPRLHITDNASTRITYNLLETMDYSSDEVFDIAYRNCSGYSFKNISSVLEELSGEDLEPLFPPMYVLRTANDIAQCFGACIIAIDEPLREIYDWFGRFFILPSSRQELIVVPDGIASPKELLSLVREVNENEVPVEDRLSNSVYIYDEFGLSLYTSDY